MTVSVMGCTAPPPLNPCTCSFQQCLYRCGFCGHIVVVIVELRQDGCSHCRSRRSSCHRRYCHLSRTGRSMADRDFSGCVGGLAGLVSCLDGCPAWPVLVSVAVPAWLAFLVPRSGLGNAVPPGHGAGQQQKRNRLCGTEAQAVCAVKLKDQSKCQNCCH